MQTIHAGKDKKWTHGHGIQSNPSNSNSQGKQRIVRVNGTHFACSKSHIPSILKFRSLHISEPGDHLGHLSETNHTVFIIMPKQHGL
jgi:hypothetical protein